MSQLTTTEIVLPGIVEPEALQIRDRRLAPPAAGQALVRVEATGVSFAEQQMRRGKYYDQPRSPSPPATTWSAASRRSAPAPTPPWSARGSPP
ncbi:hypothetical protein [Dactylosporangium darangshiense]|uniref:hypothetical protein n=1 Tax=Dactylosporangium darangshiense TaxID=579108 RepID=UPI00362D0D73